MGHTRLGRIPTTLEWKAVVAAVAGAHSADETRPAPLSHDVGALAVQSLEAAESGLERAMQDVGLRYTFFLLTQLVLAVRHDGWEQRLRDLGIQLPPDATVFDLTAQVQYAIDDYLSVNGAATDISEVAQQAAGEAVAGLAKQSTGSLFGTTQDRLKSTLHELSTKQGFARLGQRFFGCFMSHFLNFYLSRITAAQAGGTKLQQIGDISAFDAALQTHCQQTARIVYDFCGEWYSKTEFQQGINLDNTSGFMVIALKKLQAEMQQQKGGP